ncbi:PRPF18 [Cordylochernes scorpioides]|uniref:Pre-mRNA-splicing factor 18 n=1 Tax=Cordylochernes scorpioides TaxID=51811 RepID=A0ABY6LAW0_9ARAC|nr:PRPF18 [Cordylochernes scorpioides]
MAPDSCKNPTPPASARTTVVKRLRDRNEPIRLFGETDLGAFKRLRHLELLEPEIDRGFRNDFQEALEQADQRYLDELLRPQPTGNKDDPTEVAVEDQDLTMDHIHELARGLGRSSKAHDANVILTFLKFILKLWGEHLNSRSEEEKGSVHGRIASATYTQTKSYIRPLFKKLRNNTVPDDILEHLVEIVTHMLSRNYVKANDAYLQMAIGNAPWPIGVTMVGIHARTGREKIFSKNIAHVLNDETQRKFIQALKRLMTQCQRIFPTDPSRSVEYNA